MKDDKVEKYNPNNHNCPSTLIMKHPCNQVSSGGEVKYIRRDVVIEAMEMVEIDVIERYGDCVECDFEEILNSVIEDTNKEEVGK